MCLKKIVSVYSILIEIFSVISLPLSVSLLPFLAPSLNYKQILSQLSQLLFYHFLFDFMQICFTGFLVLSFHPSPALGTFSGQFQVFLFFQVLTCQNFLLAWWNGDNGFILFYTGIYVVRKCPVKAIKTEH